MRIRGVIYAPAFGAGLGGEILVEDEGGDVVEEGNALGGVLSAMSAFCFIKYRNNSAPI